MLTAYLLQIAFCINARNRFTTIRIKESILTIIFYYKMYFINAYHMPFLPNKRLGLAIFDKQSIPVS